MCLAVVYVTPSDAYWIVDCGNKALLARQLLESGYGELNFEYPGRPFDPDGRSFPMTFAIERRGGFASQFPPAYAAVSAPFLAAFGPAGLRFPAALGVAACAALLFAWLAPAVGRRQALAGGLALGLATPLLFYGVTVWEHSLTVALCLGAWIAARGAGRRSFLLAGALLGVACWLREEVALMGLALAASLVLHERRASAPLALAAGAALPLAALAVFNALAYGTPLGPHLQGPANPIAPGATPLPPPRELARQAAALLSGYGASGAQAALLGGAALAAFASGALAGRRWPALAFALLAIGLGSWLLGLVHVTTADEPLSQLVLYNGLVAQMPLACLAGLGAAAVWRRPEYAPLRVGAAAGLGFLLLAMASALVTQRAIFGVHWGPRWLLPGLPALVALALVAAREAPRSMGGWRPVWIPLVAAGVLSSALSVWLLAQQKLEAERLQTTALSQPARVVVTTHPFLAEQLADLWKRRSILRAADAPQLTALLGRLERLQVGSLLLVVPGTGETPGRIGRWTCRTAARHRGAHVHYLDLDLHLCRSRR